MFTRWNPNPSLFVFSSGARHKTMKLKGYVYQAKIKSQAGHVDSSAHKRRITSISWRPTQSYLLTHPDETQCIHAHYKVTTPQEVLSVGVVTHIELDSLIWTSKFAVRVNCLLVKMLRHQVTCLSLGVRTQIALLSFSSMLVFVTL